MDSTGYQDPVSVKNMAADRGLKIVAFMPENAAYHFLLCSPNPEFHSRSMDYFTQGIKATSELGAKIMPISCMGGTWDEDPAVTGMRAVESLKGLAPVAQSYGVILAVETLLPEESHVVRTLPELVSLLKEVNHPNVKAALDTTAMGVAGETPRQWFDILGNDIVYIHFVDGRPYGHLVWGDGLYPLESYLNVLNEFDYQGYLGQKINDGRYFDKPADADIRNFAAFKDYFID
jgi:protein FrlC